MSKLGLFGGEMWSRLIWAISKTKVQKVYHHGHSVLFLRLQKYGFYFVECFKPTKSFLVLEKVSTIFSWAWWPSVLPAQLLCPARQCTAVHHKHSHSLRNHFGEEGDHPSNINDKHSGFDLLKSSKVLQIHFLELFESETQRDWRWRLLIRRFTIIFLSFPSFS